MLESIKSNGKYIANSIFLLISCLLVISLLVQLTDERYIQVIYILLAIGLDLVRMWIVGLAKAFWSINKIKSISLWLVYLSHASIIIIASIGFSLAAINVKTESVKTYNLERQTIIDDVELNKKEITQLEASRDKLDPTSWKYQQLSQRIDALQKTDRELLGNLKNYQEVKVNIDQNVFEVLGGVIKASDTTVKLYVLFILSFLLELSLILTSWDIKIGETTKRDLIPIESPEPDFITTNKKKIIRYVDSLINGESQRLTGNERIAEQTGLELGECEKIRDLLSKTTFKGLPLIYSSQGASRSNFSKDEIKAAIKAA